MGSRSGGCPVIDHFSQSDFEEALPSGFWTTVGVQGGEFCYIVSVKPGVNIFIRSSVKRDGHSADTGKDSIRLWLSSDEWGSPLGSKEQRWIARTSNWRIRLTETLRTLWRLGKQLSSCPSCGKMRPALKVKKDGPNKDRWFMSCKGCEDSFQWLKEENRAA